MSDSNYPHRTSDTLMPSSDAFVQAFDLEDRPVIGGDEGGEWGWAGNTFEYISAQPHVQQQSWCVVMSTPMMFSRLPGGDRLHSLCKSFFENRTQKFEGLSDRTEVSFGEMKWTGHTLSIPTGAQRTFGTVTHTVYDVEGEPFTKMLETWVKWCMMDPEILSPKTVTLDDPGDMLLDEMSASCIYFEPTRNMRDIAHAQLVVAMMPRNTVPIELRRDKDEEGQIRVIQMEFTGLVEADTYAVKQIARNMLKQLPLYNPDSLEAPEGFQDRTSIVKSMDKAGNIENMTREKSKVAIDPYLG